MILSGNGSFVRNDTAYYGKIPFFSLQGIDKYIYFVIIIT